MPTSLRALGGALLVLVFSLCFVPRSGAEGFARGVVDATGPALAVGIAAAYVGSGERGAENALRTTDAILISYGASKLLKSNIRMEDMGRSHGFPSTHTACAFAAAGSLARIHPKQKWVWYAGAALVGWSLVETRNHTWKEVLGGAALGTAVGNWSISSENGLMLGRIYRF